MRITLCEKIIECSAYFLLPFLSDKFLVFPTPSFYNKYIRISNNLPRTQREMKMGQLLDEAIVFATNAHTGQVRKMANTPYILHPLEVASIIATMTGDEQTMAAGVLHDTVEDCGVDLQEIKRRFGGRVAALVQSETEDKLSERPPADTWMERKQDSLLMLRNTKDEHVKILWLADKLSNMRSFYREYCKKGNAIFQSLNQKNPAMHAWYYRSIAEYLESLRGQCAYQEYTELVEKVFGSNQQ